jgi:hypothetical protein
MNRWTRAGRRQNEVESYIEVAATLAGVKALDLQTEARFRGVVWIGDPEAQPLENGASGPLVRNPDIRFNVRLCEGGTLASAPPGGFVYVLDDGLAEAWAAADRMRKITLARAARLET